MAREMVPRIARIPVSPDSDMQIVRFPSSVGTSVGINDDGDFWEGVFVDELEFLAALRQLGYTIEPPEESEQ